MFMYSMRAYWHTLSKTEVCIKRMCLEHRMLAKFKVQVARRSSMARVPIY